MFSFFNQKFFQFLIKALFLSPFFLPFSVLGYDYNTHGYLTRETVEFYNQSFPQNQLPQELVNFLIDGSRKEDDAPRWVNHFYDPVYQRGYTPEMIIDAYPLVFASTLKQVVNWVSSKQWAQDSSQQTRTVYRLTKDLYPIGSILSTREQKQLDFSETDFTWQRAKQYWLKGEKEKAMFALGHILHLIQDASVPDHTRNDGHLGDSPYEKWSAKFNLNHSDPELSQRLKTKTPIILSSLDDYFESISRYSNNNFYSKDTIGVGKGYSLPEVEFPNININGKIFSAKNDEEKNLQLLYRKISMGSYFVEMPWEVSLDDNDVMEHYWSRLSTQAVRHSAGVINLFFQEVAQEKPEPEQPELRWYEKLWQWLTQQTNVLLGQLLPQEQTTESTQQSSTQPANSATPLVSPTSTLIPSPTASFPEPTSLSSPSPTPTILVLLSSPSPTPSPTSSPSPTLIPSPSLTPQSLPQFIGTQTPNHPSPLPSPLPSPTLSPSPLPSPTPTPITPSPSPELSPTLTPSPEPSPSPSPEPSPTPTPSVEPSPSPSPEPTPSPEPSPTPSPALSPVYQHSNNQFFDNVAWYFDTQLHPEKGGIFTLELTVNQLPSDNDYYALVAGWNSEFTKLVGDKTSGGDRPELRYSIPGVTGLILDQNDPNYGPALSLWNYNGSFDPEQFPKTLKLYPTEISTTQYVLLRKDTEEGISREHFEQTLGRPLGNQDFITLTLWPLYHQPTPSPDNTHYYGSFLASSSTPVSYPEPIGISALKNLRWGVDPDSETGYSLELEYTLPLPEITDQYSYGYELRFHLNGLADFYYAYEPNLARPWFRGNDLSNLIYLNYGFWGGSTCNSSLMNQPKSGVRFLPNRCELTPFGGLAYNPNDLPQTANPTANSWILKLPILPSPAPKPLASLTSTDYLTVSLWVNEVGPNSGLSLRQLDQRRWYFQSQYQALEPTVPPPSPSPSPSPEPSPSPSPEPSLSSEPRRQVVINEIAWMGTQASANDEWLELYNNSGEEVDLTGWVLRSTAGTPNLSLSGILPSGGYYLLERTNDEPIADLPADLIFTGAINNDCEVFELIDNLGNLQDRTGCDGSRWPAGDNDTKASMERKDPNLAGEQLSNWQTNTGESKNGLDAEGNEIRGTPKQANSR